MQRLISFFLLALTSFSIFSIESCSKSNSASNKTYLGNYYGTVLYNVNSGGGSEVDTIKVTAGATSSQIVLFDTDDSITVTGTVSGNNVTSFSGSYPAVNGYSIETYSGKGSLSGSTLSFTLFGAYTYMGVPGIDTLTYLVVKH